MSATTISLTTSNNNNNHAVVTSPPPLHSQPSAERGEISASSSSSLGISGIIQQQQPGQEEFNVDHLPIERGIKHMYNPEYGTWTSKECLVKMESTPFAYGAMKQCCRMKQAPKIGLGAMGVDWKNAPKYVAKVSAM